MSRDDRLSLDELERGVHAPREQQAEALSAEPPREYVEPEDLDRMRLLADPASTGRLDPRTEPASAAPRRAGRRRTPARHRPCAAGSGRTPGSWGCVPRLRR